MKLCINNLYNNLELDGEKVSSLPELWLCLRKPPVLLGPSSLFLVADQIYECEEPKETPSLLSCHSFLVAFCRMVQVVTFLPNIFSDPAHLGAS